METKIDPIEKAVDEIRQAIHGALTGSKEVCTCGEMHDDDPAGEIGARVILLDADGEWISGTEVEGVPPAVVQKHVPVLFNQDEVFAVAHVFEAMARQASFAHLPEEEAKAKMAELKQKVANAEIKDEAALEALLGDQMKVSTTVNIIIMTRAATYHVAFEKLPGDQGLGEELLNSYKNREVETFTNAPRAEVVPAGAVLH